MKLLLFFSLSLLSPIIRAQNANIFTIDSLSSETNIPRTAFFTKQITLKPFFEDSKFLVSEHCSGEWGGSLYFTDKNTKRVYECSSTCPLTINKINGSYFVTSTLAHLFGSWNLMEIKNPHELTKFTQREIKAINYVGDDESKSEKGTNTLLEKHNQLALLSFVYNNRLFHIVSDYEKTFVGEIINGEFINIQLISNEPFYNYDHQIIKRENNHYLVLFEDSDAKGYLEILNNNIYIHKY